jgi:pimeloyl-ACP methyl ester carboxylesterase
MLRTLAADEPKPEEISFTSSLDQTEQRYVLLLPSKFRSDEPHDLLIALHGHGSDRWQFVKQERGECKASRDFATKHNMIFVSPDYRAKTSWMGPKAEADLVQIIRELREKHRICRVFLCGGSMGGTSALAFTESRR